MKRTRIKSPYFTPIERGVIWAHAVAALPVAVVMYLVGAWFAAYCQLAAWLMCMWTLLQMRVQNRNQS